MKRRTLLGGGLAAGVAGVGGCSRGGGEHAPDPVRSASRAPMPATLSAVYFQPRVRDLTDFESRVVPANAYTMIAEPGQADSWTSLQTCVPNQARKFLDLHAASEARLLVGMSLGRLGLAYFMETTKENRSQVRHLAAVSPGSAANFIDSCDAKDTSAMLAQWLNENPANRFTVYADKLTAENDYIGIRALYFANIVGTAAVTQTAVYGVHLGHEETWNAVKDGLFAAATAQAPYAPPNAARWTPA